MPSLLKFAHARANFLSCIDYSTQGDQGNGPYLVDCNAGAAQQEIDRRKSRNAPLPKKAAPGYLNQDLP